MADSDLATIGIVSDAIANEAAKQAERDSVQNSLISEAQSRADAAYAMAEANEAVNNLDAQAIADLQALSENLAGEGDTLSALANSNSQSINDLGARVTTAEGSLTTLTASNASNAQRLVVLENGAEARDASIDGINASLAFGVANRGSIVSNIGTAATTAYNNALAA